MGYDTITRVEIDKQGRLLVFPTALKFPMIYREGVEVHWDDSVQAHYSPKPREWSYGRWLRHILDTAGTLQLTPETEWCNVDSTLKAELLEAAGHGT
ncbi:hypothetical protein J2X04_001625 [Lysobacter niabensis]|uniref:Integron Cassette Protein Hfx-Cass5 domain-containing protein n=1 Tax=Agrilutibacter niabensis TaxID=380628 RepID=A0ABU1VPT1_9GAMM|nr:hypothetical protein [Lysobacter niabensis]